MAQAAGAVLYQLGNPLVLIGQSSPADHVRDSCVQEEQAAYLDGSGDAGLKLMELCILDHVALSTVVPLTDLAKVLNSSSTIWHSAAGENGGRRFEMAHI